MLPTSRRLTSRQWLGGALLAIGLGATVVLAYVAGANKPPSQSAQVGLAALSIVASLGASAVFSGVGRADPSHAQQSASRLLVMASEVAAAKAAAEVAFESGGTKGELHTVMGMMSVHLSYIEDGLVGAVGDWRVFHPHAVEQAEGLIGRRPGEEDDV